jgi:hypothetical protein
VRYLPHRFDEGYCARIGEGLEALRRVKISSGDPWLVLKSRNLVFMEGTLLETGFRDDGISGFERL